MLFLPPRYRIILSKHRQRSAFIRTAYFNGQYTNQYSQSKTTGHLIFRRFTIPAPNTAPIFTEGAAMPQGLNELERIGEENAEDDSKFELENTECTAQQRPLLHSKGCQAVHGDTSVPKERALPDSSRLQLPLLTGPVPRLPTAALERCEGSSHRRNQYKSISSPACSVFCEEKEKSCTSRKWTRPLADMGDAASWKLGMLETINAIHY